MKKAFTNRIRKQSSLVLAGTCAVALLALPAAADLNSPSSPPNGDGNSYVLTLAVSPYGDPYTYTCTWNNGDQCWEYWVDDELWAYVALDNSDSGVWMEDYWNSLFGVDIIWDIFVWDPVTSDYDYAVYDTGEWDDVAEADIPWSGTVNWWSMPVIARGMSATQMAGGGFWFIWATSTY